MLVDIVTMAVEGPLDCAYAGVRMLRFGCWQRPDTHHRGVPEQAADPTMHGGYEVSEMLSRPNDLQRIC